MFAANVQHIVNILIFIGYFIFWKERTAWPEHFVLWPWLSYVVHVCLHHFAGNLQNTTRNIARIYLIQEYGPHYDSRLVVPIQAALVPDAMFPFTLLWVTIHIGSFVALLFVQGWATALVAGFALWIFSGFIPDSYSGHLKRVRDHVATLSSNKSLNLRIAGISPTGLAAITDQALREARDPQEWWASVRQEALEKEIEEEVSNSN